MSNLRKKILFCCAPAILVAGVLGSGPALAAEEVIATEEQGIVQEVAVSNGMVVISGFMYEIPPHAKVSVRGVSSSIAALKPGMKVRYMYEVVDDFDAQIQAREVGNVISELEQLPDSHVVEVY